MNQIKNTIKKEFTIIPNALINDNNLSDRARFIFVYMASKPDDWIFYNSEISKSLKLTIDTLRKYMKELFASGWITKHEQIREMGMFGPNVYVLNSFPKQVSPYMVFSDTEKNRNGKKQVHNKKDFNKKERFNNKYFKKRPKILK